MKNFVALLRGINVGGKGVITMPDLVASFETAGCQHVQTYIQSGNVVFQLNKRSLKTISKKLIDQINKQHGFSPNVVVFEEAELTRMIEGCPFECDQGNQLHFFFLASLAESPDLKSLMKAKSSSEQFQLADRVFYLLAPDGIGRSKLAAKVERCLGVPVTARNWNTVKKLQAMIASSSP